MLQVGVPLSIATNLTVPELVSKYNIAELGALIKNGPNKHPGGMHYMCCRIVMES